MEKITGFNESFGNFSIVPMLYNSLEDYEIYKAIVSNPEIMKTSSLFKNTIPSEEQALKDFHLKTKFQDTYNIGFCKILNSENEAMGMAGFIILNQKENTFNVEIGYFLNPKYCKNGLGSEVVNLLVSSAKKMRNINNITASCSINNIASKKILLKNNFELVDFEEDVYFFVKKIKKNFKFNICPLAILKEQHRGLNNIRIVS